MTSMFCKTVAASALGIWLLLLGVDLFGDVGLIRQYHGSETDRAVNSALTNYGKATKISNDTRIVIPPIPASQSAAFFSTSLMHSVSMECANKEKLFFREETPIFKFHLVFLI
jgi:hypothetical protein